MIRHLLPSASVTSPEGPYEIVGGEKIDRASALNVLKVVEFVAQLRDTSRSLLPLDQDLRELGIVLELFRNHLTGRITTASSLADASGLSHGTAVRAIEEMIGAGYIVRRQRTGTGKSFSLHPSAKFLRRWQVFSEDVRWLAEGFVVEAPTRTSLIRERRGNKKGKTADIIAPPAVLETKLALSRGLRVLVHADPTFMAMNALKRQFELILGVEISVRALSIDRLRRAIVDNSLQRISDYDIIACDLPWFGEMASKGRLRPLDDLIRQSDVDLHDFISDAVASTRWNGEHYGVPVMATAEMLVYRTDLLAEAGVDPPSTITELIEAARRLHSPEKGISGLAWNGGRGTALGHTFITILAAHGQPIVNISPTADGFDVDRASGENLRPMFLTDAARATAEVLRYLVPYSPPEILSMVWYDRARAFASGRAAMAYSHTLLANLFERDPNSPAYRRVGYVPHPTGLTGRPICVLGGYALSIPSNIAPERVPAVWAAIVALTSQNAAKVYIVNGSLASPRFSVNRDPEVAAVSPIIDAVDGFARRGLLRMWPRPPVPGISMVIQVAGEEVHDLLLGLKPPDRALADAQNRADALMRANGVY
jgi:multiple sugar transport system substrate-binding protein